MRRLNAYFAFGGGLEKRNYKSVAIPLLRAYVWEEIPKKQKIDIITTVKIKDCLFFYGKNLKNS